MKPVHLATSFLLAITGKRYELEWLNKTAVPKSTPVRDDDQYVAENLLPLLQDQGRVSDRIDLADFKLLRSHLNAAFNNDGAALSACFPPYKTFGSDYSTPAATYLTDKSKNHGHAGIFLVKVLETTQQGRDFLNLCRVIVEGTPPPLADLGRPLLDAGDELWNDPYSSVFGADPSLEQLAQVSATMADQTEALLRLVKNLTTLRPAYALRYLIIGVASWLFIYLVTRGSEGRDPILFMDALQGRNARIRAQSRASYSRELDRFVRSYDIWRNSARGATCSDEDWIAFESDPSQPVGLEDHFRDLGLRIGFVQPRAHQARRKHFELQADTLRVLAMSLLERDDLLPLPEFAERMGAVWHIRTGAHPADTELLRENGFGPLDTDDDLEANSRSFRELLVRLGLAIEPSDGLTLCGLNPEDII